MSSQLEALVCSRSLRTIAGKSKSPRQLSWVSGHFRETIFGVPSEIILENKILTVQPVTFLFIDKNKLYSSVCNLFNFIVYSEVLSLFIYVPSILHT